MDLDHAVAELSVPRAEPVDSFVLHAPLELMARFGLRDLLRPSARGPADARITALVDEFTARPADPDPPVDDVAAWCQANRRSFATSTAAAGHAPIGVHLRHRLGHHHFPVDLLRQAVGEIVRRPTWRIEWLDRPLPEADGPVSMGDALRQVPTLGRPGSDFIRPIVRQVDEHGIGERLLAPALAGAVREAGRACLRAGAWSMLHDDPTQAPYGWSHALTMVQGALSLPVAGVDARLALGVAATFAAGFRAAHGTVPLGPLDDDAVDTVLRDVTRGNLGAAVAAGAAHPDAHLAKYVLACVHAAEDDPAWADVYAAAASRLVDWWRRAG